MPRIVHYCNTHHTLSIPSSKATQQTISETKQGGEAKEKEKPPAAVVARSHHALDRHHSTHPPTQRTIAQRTAGKAQQPAFARIAETTLIHQRSPHKEGTRSSQLPSSRERAKAKRRRCVHNTPAPFQAQSSKVHLNPPPPPSPPCSEKKKKQPKKSQQQQQPSLSLALALSLDQKKEDRVFSRLSIHAVLLDWRIISTRMSMDFAPVHNSSSSGSLSSSSSSSSGGCFSAGSAGDGSAANAKRKLEHSIATTQTMKMARDTAQQRWRGSSSIVGNDPCAIKRSFSDGTICDVNGVDDLRIKASASSCPKSPKVVALNALHKTKSRVISPRVGVSPHMGSAFGGSSASLHHTTAACVEEEEEEEEETCSRKHGQLSPLQLDRGALIQQQPEEPPQSPPPSATTTTVTSPRGKFARSRSSELLSPLCNAPSPSSPRPSYHQYHHSTSGSTKTTKLPQMSSSSSLAIDMDLDSTSSSSNWAANAGIVDMPVCAVAASVPKRVTSTWQPQQQQPPKKNRNPGNLSLDLSQMEQPTFDPSANGGNSSGACLRRNDSAAVCSRVTDFLYVGGASAAKDRDALLQVGITHIINCAANVAPDFFPNDFLYYNIRLRDHSSQDIARHFYNVFDFIEKARRRGGRVFVHCVKGISRSPTMAIAYLMWYKRIGMYKALDFIRQARPVVDPNAGFIFQLTEWEHLHCEGSIKFQRTVVFRVEVPRESSGNDNGSCAAEKPLLIGPLTAIGEDYFHNPSKEIAKLSFIVSCADYMFVWCGAEASDLQVEASQHATALLQNYESFPEKYEIVYHGQESSSFWSLVGALHPDES